MDSLLLKKHIISTLIALSLFFNSVICHASLIFINEIHYDNTGADKNEFVELAGVRERQRNRSCCPKTNHGMETLHFSDLAAYCGPVRRMPSPASSNKSHGIEKIVGTW